MRIGISGVLVFCSTITLLNCGKKSEVSHAEFTKADSLTDVYLSLQDSMLLSWNMMINDDNQKIEAMHSLLHELMLTSSDAIELSAYEEQLDRLTGLRYDQKSMANEDLIEEYDFASNLLVTELISRAESRTEFAYNTTLQRLIDDIRIADQRVNIYRESYDMITSRYNAFLEANRNHLSEFSFHDSLKVRPLFQMTYDN